MTTGLTTLRDSLPPGLKRAIHATSRGYGRLTASGRVLPTLLIAGGQRCGTTSLYRTLSRHPVVLKPVLHKGVHYFDTGYHRGLPWYRAHFPLRRTADAIARQHGAAPQVFESSPYYLYHPLAPQRIARDLPGCRLLVLVRDPVERAYSQHAHEVARGFETETDFARALALEASRLAGETERLAADPEYRSHSHQHHGYRARGQYIDYLEQAAVHIGRDRIHVVDSGRLFGDPARVYGEIVEFLGLPSHDFPGLERHNARPRTDPVPDYLRQRLADQFAPYDERLARWVGWTPSWRCR